jgi:peptidoglycan hydrolase-like protein with peptidoglycan-binding domain
MAEKRTIILCIVLTTVGVAASGAWFAGSRIESPADAAARTAPPAPSPILVPVEERVLSSDIVTRGTVRFGLPQPISIPPSTLKGSAGLITTLPLRNTQFNEGDVIMTASGRPVFALQGQVPTYRDFVPGKSGDDVLQLEQALARLGFDPGPIDGVYDEQTSRAVESWYKSKKWEPFGPTRDQIASVRALEREWGDAEKARISAEAASAAAGLAVAAARATATHNLRAAAVDGAARTPPGAPPLTVQNERAKAEYANTAAAADLEVQIADHALIALDPRQTETARKAAEAKLQMARAAKERIRIEGELAVQAAERDAKMLAQRAELTRSAQWSAKLEGEKAIRAALDAQKLAALDAKMATDRASQLASDLEAAKRRLGIQVPADEVVFIRSFPARVEDITASIGAAATGSIMSVTDNQLAIDSSLPLDAAPLVKPGMPVAIDEPAVGVKATGAVETVANTPGTRGVDGFHIYMGVRINPTPVRLEGFSVRLTIPIQSTKGTVTAVPVSALSLATDGTSRIQVQNNGALEYVAVRPGLSAHGYVEVAAEKGKLSPGTLVVVGYNSSENKDQK